MTAEVIAAKPAADEFDVDVAVAGNVDLADATVGEIKGHGRRAAAGDGSCTQGVPFRV